jgi:hypothetical protein
MWEIRDLGEGRGFDVWHDDEFFGKCETYDQVLKVVFGLKKDEERVLMWGTNLGSV